MMGRWSGSGELLLYEALTVGCIYVRMVFGCLVVWMFVVFFFGVYEIMGSDCIGRQDRLGSLFGGVDVI